MHSCRFLLRAFTICAFLTTALVGQAQLNLNLLEDYDTYEGNSNTHYGTAHVFNGELHYWQEENDTLYIRKKMGNGFEVVASAYASTWDDDNLVDHDGKVYFDFREGHTNSWQLWSFDGTNVEAVIDNPNIWKSSSHILTSFNDTLFVYTQGDRCWVRAVQA